MMKRRWFLPAIVLTACSRRPEAREPLLPQTVADVWHRKALSNVPSAGAPAPIPEPSIRRVVSSSYDGPGTLKVDVYDLTSSTAGLNAVQKWRPSADTVFFYKGNYFAVIRWEKADRKALQAFVRDLEKYLGDLH